MPAGGFCRRSWPVSGSVFVDAGYDSAPDGVIDALLAAAAAVPAVRPAPAPSALLLDYKDLLMALEVG